MASTFDNRAGLNKGRGAHFRFNIEGKTYTYCYIRKNACSAFKRLICGVSEFRENVPAYRNNLQFMNKFHCIDTLEEISESDHILFVYRDPVERALSLYLNKFVLRKGNKDIFENYYSITACNPEQATFREFVIRYLSKIDNGIDPHCHTQYSHLKRVKYTNVIFMRALHKEMTLLIGKELSDQYFKHKSNASTTNSSKSAPLFYGDTSSAELHTEHHNYNASILSKDTFIDDSISMILKEIYHEDFTLISGLNANNENIKNK